MRQDFGAALLALMMIMTASFMGTLLALGSFRFFVWLMA